MPDFIITQTAQEYSAYSKAKARKQAETVVVCLIFSAALCGLIYYVLWSMVH